MAVPIARKVAEGGFAGDERGVNAQLVGVGIASPGQLGIPAAFGLVRTVEFVPDDFRLPARGNRQSASPPRTASSSVSRRRGDIRGDKRLSTGRFSTAAPAISVSFS